MGKGDQSTTKSDSGYGDDASVSSHTSFSQNHPLSRKGYEIGPASNLQVGDVFEFLWTDSPEFEWEWKCLGYTKFIVLRHSDTFPHHCICIPISVGTKHDFAKPGIDHFQQGFVFAHGERNPGVEQPGGGPKLPYSAVGVEVRPGRLRIKEDSRANYADIIEVDGDAQVMVVGDVAMYFDRVRRNVNRASMRQVLRKALEEYRKNGKVGNPNNNNVNNNTASGSGPDTMPPDTPVTPAAIVSTTSLPMIHENPSRSGSIIQPVMDRRSSTALSTSGGALLAGSDDDSESEPFDQEQEQYQYQYQYQRAVSPTKSVRSITREGSVREKRDRDRVRDREVHREHSHRRKHSSVVQQQQRDQQQQQAQQQQAYRPPLPTVSSTMIETRPMRGPVGPGAGPPLGAPPPPPPTAGTTSDHPDYDRRSMHNVAMAGLK